MEPETKEVRALYRHARISAQKARHVTREIQGRPVAEALDIVSYTPRKAARLVAKTLRSAVANAENNNGLKPDTLIVKEATVGEGPGIRRFRARARGGASPIRKRTSHIRIILAEQTAKESSAKAEKKAKNAKKD
jgi:large subunit ribosomal protein L22